MNKESLTQWIKTKFYEEGFLSCGISKAAFLEQEAPHLEQFLKNDFHGKMDYMANHFDVRLDPTLLLDGAKSVISATFNYFPESEIEGVFKISKYAYGKDYHNVLKKKLKRILQAIKEEVGDINGRAFVDSAPLLEKAWAAKSGLGWVGKNANLITKNVGSFYFLVEMVVDFELEYDHAVKDFCGTCTRCIDACPTDAIVGNQQIDGSKCISYFTIELKEEMSKDQVSKWNDWVFGCDICQDVCPWNRFSKQHEEEKFLMNNELKDLIQKNEWKEITEDIFENLFAGTPLRRAGFHKLINNVNFLED